MSKRKGTRTPQQTAAQGAAVLRDVTERAQAALKLLDQATADQIIGTEPDEHRTLIQGAQAILAMEWGVYKSHGLRENPQSLKRGAQTMAMILTLIHYAYALGVRRGRSDATGSEG